ncbi:MAG: type II toxin-antitoxin system VapC family toxin [Solirubrobacterales bacterium]|nr:type II toxin-antitoxin system VapC family toxin [Solirubrobacterales bacterium]
MIVDTSAIVAIVQGEPEAEEFAASLLAAEDPRISAANYLEAGLVVDSAGDPVVSRELDVVVKAARISIQPFSAKQAVAARQAYKDFGKGSGHPAGLNFGDCFAYALASETGEPLLFKGDDFVHTDITSAV